MVKFQGGEHPTWGEKLGPLPRIVREGTQILRAFDAVDRRERRKNGVRPAATEPDVIGGDRNRVVTNELQLMDIRFARQKLSKAVPNAMAQGQSGVRIVRALTGGTVAPGYKDPYDLMLPNGIRLEVKYSSATNPSRSKTTKRWTWRNPVGQNHTKQYDLLLLVGEIDVRYREQYPSGCDHVFFCIPREKVIDVVSSGWGTIALNTNLVTAKGPLQGALKEYIVSAEKLKRLGLS